MKLSRTYILCTRSVCVTYPLCSKSLVLGSLQWFYVLLYSIFGLPDYAKFCRTQCPSYLYEKPVVFKALDNLIESELVVSGKEALNVSTPITSGRTSNIAVIQMPNYKPLFTFVSMETLSACLDAYPNCPVELRFWIHSRTYWSVGPYIYDPYLTALFIP